MVKFFGGGGGRKEVAICDRAGELDHTAHLPTSTTPQSTSARGGGGWKGFGDGVASSFCEWILVEFFGRGGVG